MTAAGVLLRGRAKAEAQMVDACIIRRGSEETTDPDTGVVSTTPGATVYAGKCQVQSRTSVAASPDAGGHSFVEVSRVVKIPMNLADVQDDDEVEMTASLLNDFAVGKKYRVEGFTPDTYDTAARLPVKEMTS